MWFGFGFMWLWPIGLIILGIIIYFAVVGTSHKNNCSSNRSYSQQPYYANGRALEILKERYAKGEITKEQFQQMKEELSRI